MASETMFRFIGTTSRGLPQKRSQSLRACKVCRKRKKRCTHDVSDNERLSTARSLDDHHQTSQSQTESVHGSSNMTVSSSHIGDSRGHQVSPPSSARYHVEETDESDDQNESTNGETFVGELNPESVFLAAATPQTPHSSTTDAVGVWVPRNAPDTLPSRFNGSLPRPDSLFTSVLLPYIQRQCQQSLPEQSDYVALFRIYIEEVHPMFPVINLDTTGPDTLDTSSSILGLKLAISLAASTSPRAKPFLKLFVLPISDRDAREYDRSNVIDQLAMAIRSSVDLGFIKDRLVVVQVLAVLALVTQFTRAANTSAETAARAISQAQTMGLHLDIPIIRKNRDYLKRLFCCIWVIDKFSAAFQGRPTMLHEHDFAKDILDTAAAQEGCFRLLVRVTSLLDRVIALYRPVRDVTRASDHDNKLPHFEDLIHECNATRIPANLLASIELLYHAVVMLSCRIGSTASTDASAGIHETMSASSVTSIIGAEFRDQISHISFVPYALSLSIRVYYRELRFSSKSPFTRNRVRRQLLNACTLLRECFTTTFPSAIKVAELAEQTVKEMDKVSVSILQQHKAVSSIPEDVTGNTHEVQVGGNQRLSGQNFTEPHTTAPDPDAFYPAAFEDLPDLDVFDYFDSEFQLDAIDAFLVDNTTLHFPLTSNSEDHH